MKKLLLSLSFLLIAAHCFCATEGVGIAGYGFGYLNDPYSLNDKHSMVGYAHFGAMNFEGGFLDFTLRFEQPRNFLQIDWKRKFSKELDLSATYYSNSGGYRLILGKEFIL